MNLEISGDGDHDWKQDECLQTGNYVVAVEASDWYTVSELHFVLVMIKCFSTTNPGFGKGGSSEE